MGENNCLTYKEFYYRLDQVVPQATKGPSAATRIGYGAERCYKNAYFEIYYENALSMKNNLYLSNELSKKCSIYEMSVFEMSFFKMSYLAIKCLIYSCNLIKAE